MQRQVPGERLNPGPPACFGDDKPIRWQGMASFICAFHQRKRAKDIALFYFPAVPQTELRQ